MVRVSSSSYRTLLLLPHHSDLVPLELLLLHLLLLLLLLQHLLLLLLLLNMVLLLLLSCHMIWTGRRLRLPRRQRLSWSLSARRSRRESTR